MVLSSLCHLSFLLLCQHLVTANFYVFLLFFCQDLLRVPRSVLRLSQQTGGSVHETTQRHDPLPNSTVGPCVSVGLMFRMLLPFTADTATICGSMFIFSFCFCPCFLCCGCFCSGFWLLERIDNVCFTVNHLFLLCLPAGWSSLQW